MIVGLLTAALSGAAAAAIRHPVVGHQAIHRRGDHHAGRDRARTDRKGQPQHGIASYYAPRFDGRRMADGGIFRPNSNAAASKTLPLGTVAKVTNLKNGRTTTVHVEDRGPYVHGRVIDVAPKVARQLGMKRAGLAPVVVKPVALPTRHDSAGEENGASGRATRRSCAATRAPPAASAKCRL